MKDHPRNNKARVKELEAELAELKEKLGAEPQDLDGWMMIPEEIRDRFAARALMQSAGDWKTALKCLGFRVSGKITGEGAVAKVKAQTALREAVLNTRGVQAILRRTLDADEARRKATIDRLFEEVEFGPGDRAVRAAQPLAKLAGWIKDEPPPQQTVTIHLASLVGGVALEGHPQKRVHTIDQPKEPLTSIDSVLAHEPGAAKPLDDEHAGDTTLTLKSAPDEE